MSSVWSLFLKKKENSGEKKRKEGKKGDIQSRRWWNDKSSKEKNQGPEKEKGGNFSWGN